jgi:hypothetical protein
MSPLRTWPQTNETDEFVTLTRNAGSVIAFEDGDDLSRQLLFRRTGSVELENEARWAAAAAGKKPVIVINAWPSYESALGTILKSTGEKSKTVTRWGSVMLKTGRPLPWSASNSKVHM